MDKSLVLYHASCADGFGAAWAAWKYFGDNADYKPVSYGGEVPDVQGYKRVYLVDFSYPLNVINKMREGAPYSDYVIIIDHHKSAQEMLKDYPFAEFDMAHSGACLTWLYFHRAVEVPQLIKTIEDRDLWLFKLPNTRELSAWIWSYPYDFELWSRMAEILEQ